MEFRAPLPFVHLLGLELLRYENGEAELAVSVRDELCNSWGMVHGGVTMTLLDVAMAHAAHSPRGSGSEAGRGVVTVEMKTSFMRPGLGRLLARGKLLTRTATLAFCEGSVFDADQELVAHATGTFKYIRSLPVDGKLVPGQNASD